MTALYYGSRSLWGIDNRHVDDNELQHHFINTACIWTGGQLYGCLANYSTSYL